MYEDNENYKMRINWKDIIIKIILVILFILLLIWLFPKTDLDVFYDSVYINNVNTMKEAAKSYYTKDRLPQNVGESTSMSLKQMIDNKMLIRFTDRDKNYCDETTSKVEVTKTADDKYVLKVQLHCGEQKDYILETIGCNDVCTGSNCNPIVTPGDDNKDDDTNKPSDPEIPSDPKGDQLISITYYQHRKAIYNTKTELFCFEDGYTLDGNKCRKLTDIVIDATPVDKEQYSCPDGYTLNGAYCFKYTTPSNDKYTCPTGYMLSGTQCIQTYDATYRPNTGYTCPNGGSLNGTQCIITTTGHANMQNTCPAGYSPNGSNCYAIKDATPNPGISCPLGYSPNGSQCISTIDGTPEKSYGNWVNKGTKYYTSATKAYTKNTEKMVYVGATSGAVCGDPCNNTGVWYKYIYYTRSVKTTYTCPKEYTPNGSKCVSTTAGTPKVDYTCPNGWTLDGTKCKSFANYTSSVASYSCPNGYSGGGSSSVCSLTYGATSIGGGYTCPNGGDLNGSKCTIIKDATKTCPEGYTLNGSRCELKIDASKINYTCPDDYTLSGNKCIKKSEVVKDANTSTTTSISYEYKWSKNSFIEGWEFTGKTKTETKYTAGQK